MTVINVEHFLKYPIKITSISKLKPGKKIKRHISARFTSLEIVSTDHDLIKLGRQLIIKEVKNRVKKGELPIKKVEKLPDEGIVNVGYDCALKIMIRYIMVHDQISLDYLSEILMTNKKKLKRQLSFKKETSIEKISAIFDALGYPLQIMACCKDHHPVDLK